MGACVWKYCVFPNVVPLLCCIEPRWATTLHNLCSLCCWDPSSNWVPTATVVSSPVFSQVSFFGVSSFLGETYPRMTLGEQGLVSPWTLNSPLSPSALLTCLVMEGKGGVVVAVRVWTGALQEIRGKVGEPQWWFCRLRMCHPLLLAITWESGITGNISHYACNDTNNTSPAQP